MGYLSQKKHKFREAVILYIASIVFAIIALVLFLQPEFTLFKINLFHFYCLSIIFFIWAIISRKLLPSIVIGITCIITYTQLSIAGNIFLSDDYNGDYTYNITYTDSLQVDAPITKGKLFLYKQEFAQYAVINSDAPLLVVRISLNDLPDHTYPTILKELNKFIVKQDIPVVLFGDFNMPSWAHSFRNFSEYSGLKVKNRLIFANAQNHGLFAVPHFYILGYSHLGISNLKTAKKSFSAQINYSLL